MHSLAQTWLCQGDLAQARARLEELLPSLQKKCRAFWQQSVRIKRLPRLPRLSHSAVQSSFHSFIHSGDYPYLTAEHAEAAERYKRSFLCVLCDLCGE